MFPERSHTVFDPKRHRVPCQGSAGRVVQVHDATTVSVRTNSGDHVRARIFGISTPMAGEPYAHDAEDFLKRQLQSATCLHFEGPPSGPGRYAPVSIYTAEGIPIAAVMCARGYAWADAKSPALVAAQKLAYHSSLGMWSDYDLPENAFDAALRMMVPYAIIFVIAGSILGAMFTP